MSGQADVRTRVATVADVGDLASVQLASALAGFAHIFPDSVAKPTQPALEKEWMALLDAPATTVLAAVRNESIVAGVVFGYFPALAPEGWGHLAKLYVMPEQSGLGIGGQLHDIAVDRLRTDGYESLWLWVLEGNTRARGMYERRGWVAQEARRTDFPGSGIFEMGYALEV